ncbi:putative hydrophobic protein (TIGR00271 family) [Vulcaniibacterium tengchongense]|uniref:Putative hydrophobic protein (TIGR00271 family) n=2 Tax=Vulcaniibacterium tengchongense TaxID=1273429 RepID=A0A3N4VC02_9GAMM|nr:DUF389 domain-containing protein [Vulcaniibacterium tengchongense]RPE80148.1 putative hydrophobic protein (TIGR00271 family) [Vulcaniibacterium tengchongense]
MLTPAVAWRWLQQWRRKNLELDRAAVLGHVRESGALAPRYAFMCVMACGIALLGLLQNSAAVIIGAMLISPLMGPIVEMGMALATFDFRALRSALTTIAVGIGLALATSILIVAASPLREATPEILARTQPNLFDLLVALFSGLAGAYATITRKGETIVGVAIATALMPPLAVVGYGIATGSPGIAGGAAFLFMTNLLTISLSVTVMALWYGFGHRDSPKQTAWQAALIVGSFLVLSIPLGLALRDITERSKEERTVRTTLDEAAGRDGGRVGSLRVERGGERLHVDAMLLTPRHRPGLAQQLERRLEDALGRPVSIDLREVVTADDDALAREQDTLAQLRDSVLRLQNEARQNALARSARDEALAALRERAVAAFGSFDVLDDGQQALWRLRGDAGLDVAAARRLEAALRQDGDGPRVAVVPALQGLPAVAFGDGSAELDEAAQARLQDIAWALARWDAGPVRVEGYAGSDARLARERAEAVAAWLRERGVAVAEAAGADAASARALGAREGAAAQRSARVTLLQ